MTHIVQVRYYQPDQHNQAAFSVLWSTGVTDFYPWANYPEQAHLHEIKPHFHPYGSSISFFHKAPAHMTHQEIFEHNLRNYIPSARVAAMPKRRNPVPLLEAIAEEQDKADRNRLLYPCLLGISP